MKVFTAVRHSFYQNLQKVEFYAVIFDVFSHDKYARPGTNGKRMNCLFIKNPVSGQLPTVQGGISWNLSSLTICHSLTITMATVSEWQIVSDDKFHEMPPRYWS